MPLPSVHPQSGDTESLDWDPQEGNRGTSDIQSGSQLTSEPAKEGEKPQFPEHLLCWPSSGAHCGPNRSKPLGCVSQKDHKEIKQ